MLFVLFIKWQHTYTYIQTTYVYVYLFVPSMPPSVHTYVSYDLYLYLLSVGI